MDNLIIVGAGPMGRELYSWLLQHPDLGIKWNIKGFLDDEKYNKYVHDDPINNYPIKILNTIKLYEPCEQDRLIVAIGDPRAKKSIVEQLNVKNVRYFTFIHPSVNLATNVQIGEGSIICPNTIISCDSSIGNHVIINLACTIGHDVTIGEYVTLSSHVDITGNCELKEGVFMGSHAVVLPKTIVGKYATIGAGSVGIRKIQENSTILGVPGKKFSIK